MCLICASIETNKITPLEAWRNLSEMHEGMEEEHVEKVLEKIGAMHIGEDEDVELIESTREENEDFPFFF